MPSAGRPTKRKELWIAKDPFLKVLQDACHLSYRAQGLPVSDQERQLEDSFFRAAVALETFLGDWFARCLHFDTSRVASRTRDEVEKHLNQEIAGGWEPDQKILARTLDHYTPQISVSLKAPKAVSVVTARQLLGTTDRNRSWKSAADFKEQVGRYLAHEPSRTATGKLSAEHDALLNATIALRNVLAHGSPDSERQLREALDADDLHADLRVKQITSAGVGRYLRIQQGGHPRFRRYYLSLAGVANTLAPFVGKPRAICP
jgi:hypothetical protein